ncbi:IclR family transcriptional regulator [Novosphingobium lindaniclasticum]|uniref:HTH iclR-type domain-containing protein n=1 Tax=Novosphingobium lindaniclasticum LE124 TaxID=1096930 RepID=T0HMR9_9SPHN|nr:helix-turn-helix domain-containing protein [Novosphingobium lindaniclasticum]EQB14297.1 hypothetical protein L284_12950 [Novosphingobium lindaniclasticum LE124]
MSRQIGAKSIKSAQRVFEVLEYFDADHREAGVMDIARRFNYPQSSASELLSYMVSLGYLRRGRGSRSYELSMRVAMLGAWVQPRLVRDGRLLPLMDSLAEQTRGSVVLASNNGVELRCFHAVCRNDVGGGDSIGAVQQGDMLPLLHSAEGLVLLSRCERQLVRRYVHRLNAEAVDAEARVSFDELAARLDEVSDSGFAWVEHAGGLSIAVNLPQSEPTEPLALGLRVGPGACRETMLRMMQSAMSRHLGLFEVMPPAHSARPSWPAAMGAQR